MTHVLVYASLLNLERCYVLPPVEQTRQILNLEPQGKYKAREVLSEDLPLSARDLVP